MDRIEDDELRKKYTLMRCQLCNQAPSEGHHIKSRGSWGPDLEINLIALCRQHHTMIHQYGINKMIGAFPKLKPLLISKGFLPTEIGSGSNMVVKWLHKELTGF